MSVRWTESALGDLQAIQTHIALHSAKYARATVERLLNRTAVLEDHPQLGAVVPEYGQESVRELAEWPYRIVNWVSGADVDVLAVVHGARRMPAL
jgi:toxin ParE1/3/4